MKLSIICSTFTLILMFRNEFSTFEIDQNDFTCNFEHQALSLLESRFPDLDWLSLGVKKFGSLRKCSSGSLGVLEAWMHKLVCCCMICTGCLKFFCKFILSTLRVTICNSTETFSRATQRFCQFVPSLPEKDKREDFSILDSTLLSFSIFPFSTFHVHLVWFQGKERLLNSFIKFSLFILR